jgi:hypothetical protein
MANLGPTMYVELQEISDNAWPNAILQNDIIILFKEVCLAVDCISWTAEMHILFYASPSFNILPIGVPSVANYKGSQQQIYI